MSYIYQTRRIKYIISHTRWPLHKKRTEIDMSPFAVLSKSKSIKEKARESMKAFCGFLLLLKEKLLLYFSLWGIMEWAWVNTVTPFLLAVPILLLFCTYQKAGLMSMSRTWQFLISTKAMQYNKYNRRATSRGNKLKIFSSEAEILNHSLFYNKLCGNSVESV